MRVSAEELEHTHNRGDSRTNSNEYLDVAPAWISAWKLPGSMYATDTNLVSRMMIRLNPRPLQKRQISLTTQDPRRRESLSTSYPSATKNELSPLPRQSPAQGRRPVRLNAFCRSVSMCWRQPVDNALRPPALLLSSYSLLHNQAMAMGNGATME